MRVKPRDSSHAAGPRRRGRPPLPQNNKTRERLQTAALGLFAKASYAEVSIREITDLAGQSVGAVSYHFGSKQALYKALILRASRALLAERLALLRQVEAQVPTEAKLRAILFALIAPVIRWSRQPQTQARIVPLIERARLDGPLDVRRLLQDTTSHLQPFIQALRSLLPDMPASEIGWRLHFVLGIEHAIHFEAARLESLIGSPSQLRDPKAIAARVVDFVLPGWLATSN
jgi:AcrR family transcriptional regulator